VPGLPERRPGVDRVTLALQATVCDNGLVVDQLAEARHRPMSDELLVPRPTRRGQIATTLFGLLAITSVAVPAVSDVAPMPATTLINIGCMLMCGFAELVDRSLRMFSRALRLVGAGIAVFGFVLGLL